MENQKQKAVETKHDKFVRLASKRTQGVLNSLRLLKGCASTFNYEYSQAEVDYIFQEIDAALAEVKAAYVEKPKVKAKTFSLLDLAAAGDAGDAAEPAQE